KVSKTFVKKDIPVADLSTILWAGLGLRKVDAVSSATKAERNISFSGDNAYINIYVLTEKGSWKYLADKNSLQFISGADVRSKVSPAAVSTASALILYTVDNALTPSFLKSNPALFLQMSHATAGFAAQNIALTASSLKIASIIQYTLKAADAGAALKLAKDEAPLFIQQLGYTE
ncbi:nitroreductase family protein, partial [bacterium]|nr:nitroreductase family protein [bacterium]